MCFSVLILKKSKNIFLALVVIVCFSSILNAQTTSNKNTTKKQTILCNENHGNPIVEEIHHDTCYRIYNVCDFHNWKKKWFTLGEIANNIVLDSNINYGVFYFLDNATVDNKSDFFTIINNKSVQNKAICKFYYNSPSPDIFYDPFKTGKYKYKNEGLPGF